MEFLRRCPSCGKRFAVRVDSKVLVDRALGSEKIVHNIVTGMVGGFGRGYSMGNFPTIIATTEDVPIERDTFDIFYECKHCHHQWSEKLTVVRKEKPGTGPTELGIHQS